MLQFYKQTLNVSFMNHCESGVASRRFALMMKTVIL